MKIKSGVWYWLAVASGAVGLLYGMGLEGSFQTTRVERIASNRDVLP